MKKEIIKTENHTKTITKVSNYCDFSACICRLRHVTNYFLLPSLPIPGFLKIYMLWAMAGFSNPSWKAHSFTFSLRLTFLNTGLSSCKACPILFKAILGSTKSFPSESNAPVS